MKIYKDKQKTKQILLENVSELGATEIDFGIAPAGISTTFSLFVENDGPGELLNLNLAIDNPPMGTKIDSKVYEKLCKEVVVEGVSKIGPGETGELKLTWTPSVSLKEKFKVYFKLYGSELI